MANGGNITEAEAALYDRQIRLWGLDAQKRLRKANVLLIGLKGLGAEVAKNIVLAGVNGVTLLDSTEVDEEDRGAQFLIARSDVGKNRAEASLARMQELNPMVQVTVDMEPVSEKKDDFFKQFSVICATCCNQETIARLDSVCAEANIMFYAGDVFGFYGFFFADLGVHEYAEEIEKRKPKAKKTDTENGEPPSKKMKVEDEKVVVKRKAEFMRFEQAMKFKWTGDGQKLLKRTSKVFFIMQVLLKFLDREKRRPCAKSRADDIVILKNLRTEVLEDLEISPQYIPEDFTQYCFGDLSPVCAIVGGVLAQEIIKGVSQKDEPHNNFFLFSGLDNNGIVDKIGA